MDCQPVATRTRIQFLTEYVFMALKPNNPAQRPPPETPGRLREPLTNYLHRPTVQRGGGSFFAFLPFAFLVSETCVQIPSAFDRSAW